MDLTSNVNSSIELDSLIFKFIARGDVNNVESLIKEFGIDFRHHWCNGYMLLCEAVRSKQFGVARFLLDSGAAVDIPETSKKFLSNKIINSPLQYALEFGDNELVNIILSKGLNYNGFDGDAVLLTAIKNGRLDVVRMLLEYNSVNNFVDFNTTSCLIDASVRAGTDSIGMLELLLQYCPKLSLNSKQKHIPLLLVTALNRIDTVTYLLDRGEDINSVDADGRTPVSIASDKGYEELFRLLIVRGSDIGIRDCSGRIPLHYACDKSHLNIVRSLLAEGSDFNAEDNEGYTPLHAALCQRNLNISIIEILLQYGADVNIPSKEGDTPFHMAFTNDNFFCIKGRHADNTNVVKLLVENDANVNMLNGRGYSPLYYTAKYNKFDIFSLLICYGGDVNQMCEEGTPLSAVPEVDRASLSFPCCIHSMHRNAIKWKALNLLKIPNVNINSLHPEALSLFEKYEEECKSELKYIKKFNSNLYFLLTYPINDIAYLVRNHSLMEFIYSKECASMFPLYQSIVTLRWKRAQVRFQLLQDCQDFSEWLEGFIPDCCVELITSYLSNKDLKSLSKW